MDSFSGAGQVDASYEGQPDLERRKYDFAHGNLFGIEIHETLGRVCQTNLLLHKDGHTNVETDRSCLDSAFANTRIRADGTVFTVALGNPPFGDKVKADDNDALGGNTLDAFEMGRGHSQVKSEIIILERAFEFLQPGGRLAMVVPDGLLNNSGEQSRCPTFRRFLLRVARVNAVISLPDHAFRKAGAQNKTSILFATKYTEAEKAQIDAEYHDELTRSRSETQGATPDSSRVATTGAGEEGDEIDAPPLTLEALSKARLEEAAVAALVARHDYPIFLAEASQIGYSPSGVTISENDLYTLSNGLPERSESSTILGQYFAFAQDPPQYKGVLTPECMMIRASELFTAHPTYRMDPKFHLFERERLQSPPPGMKLLRLGDVLKRREENVNPPDEPDREFVVPTLTQEGDLTPREPGQGKNPPSWFGQYFTGGSRWYVVHADDLLFSQIDLWKGCVTIVPQEWDGTIVTQEFPIYQVDKDQLDPHYLKLVLRSKYFRRAIRAITTGHSNRRRTQPYDFENLTIFAPQDKDVQKRVGDAIKAGELSASTSQATYRDFLEAFDQLVVGQISPQDILATRSSPA